MSGRPGLAFSFRIGGRGPGKGAALIAALVAFVAVFVVLHAIHRYSLLLLLLAGFPLAAIVFLIVDAGSYGSRRVPPLPPGGSEDGVHMRLGRGAIGIEIGTEVLGTDLGEGGLGRALDAPGLTIPALVGLSVERSWQHDRGGTPVRVLELTWKDPMDRGSVRRWLCALARNGMWAPPVAVRPKGPGTHVLAMFGLGEVHLESSAFEAMFDVRGNDALFATALLDQRMMEWLMVELPLGHELGVAGPWVVFFGPWEKPPLGVPPESGPLLEKLEGFLARIPPAARSMSAPGGNANADP